MRRQTRNERYSERKDFAREMPVWVSCTNLEFDENVGMIIRAAACFGAKGIKVLGPELEYQTIRRKSANTSLFFDIEYFKRPEHMISWAKENGIQIVSIELTDFSKPLSEVKFNFDKPILLVTGHETYGVPESIIHNSDVVVEIPMYGFGACLNTSQAVNVVLYEISKQYF
jgi:23S rRNA (guanosine2251-2'-O)-methyltransferase